MARLCAQCAVRISFFEEGPLSKCHAEMPVAESAFASTGSKPFTHSCWQKA